MRKLILLFTCGLLATQSMAEVYRYTDAQGNTVFTDNPPQHTDAQRVELPTLNSLPKPPHIPSAPTRQPVSSTMAGEQAIYSTLALDIPNEESIRANNGSFSVSVSIEPPLSPQHSLQLLVDGQPHGGAVRGLRLHANNLDRGEHSIAVQVIVNGQVIQQSTAQTISVQRTHINAPTRRAKP